jgi:hypothetical protein
MEGEGLPDILFKMKDDVAMGVFSQMSGHGLDLLRKLIPLEDEFRFHLF